MHGMKALISMLVAVLLPGMPSEMSAVPQLSADRQPTSQGSVMPGNPNQELPTTISPDIPNNATVVAGNLAVLSNGTVKSLNTGATVTSPKIVGTRTAPPDPLSKTNGSSFIPTSVSKVRAAMTNESDKQPSTTTEESSYYSASSYQAHNAALSNGEYGAYWGSYNDSPAFFGASGNFFAQQASGVIDVSQWQGNIDWARAKASGVQGAIIRIGFGWGNDFDTQALRNIRECKRLGIPFGIYLYSYAYDVGTAADEGADVVSKLRAAGVNPGDLSYPIFYDLEAWSWQGHSHPTSPTVYSNMADAWYSKLLAAGYTNLGVYSYTAYLRSELNSSSLHAKTRWVADYGPEMSFDFSTNDRGWQYSDQGNIAGISGTVDLNAFGNKNYVDEDPSGKDPSAISAQLSDITEGDYYIISSYSQKVIDIAWADKSNGVKAEIWQYNGGANQIFHIKPLSNHKYTIIASHSQRALDVFGGQSSNGAAVIQYTQTGSANQQWQIYRTSQGTIVFKSMTDSSKNRFLDVTSGNSADGTSMELWGLNGGINQQFRIVPVGEYRPGAQGWTTVNGVSYWFTNGVRASTQELLDPESGNWYYFDGKGQRVSGWYTLTDGRHVYYDPSNHAMVHGERYIDGHWYYFDANGNMIRNQDVWIATSKKWVRYDEVGHMVYGENFHDGGWYYFDSITGAMSKGWKYIEGAPGKWVYYNVTTGQMLHGEACINSNWYYFNDITGATTYGWKSLNDGRRVYYDTTYGWMLKGWNTIDGRSRHFDEVTGAVTN